MMRKPRLARKIPGAGRGSLASLATIVALALASCGPYTSAPTTLVIVNQSPDTITLNWNTPGFLGPIGASTRSEDVAGCARDDHGVMASDSGLAIRSHSASLPIGLPPSAETATLYYLVLPDGHIEATTADVADAIPTPDVDAPVPSVCPTPGSAK